MRRGRFARASRRSICVEEVVVKYIQTVASFSGYLLADQKRLRSKRFHTHPSIIHSLQAQAAAGSWPDKRARQADKHRQTDIRQVGQSWLISAPRSNAPYTNLGDTPAATRRDIDFLSQRFLRIQPDALHAEGKNVDFNCTRERCLITTTFSPFPKRCPATRR